MTNEPGYYFLRGTSLLFVNGLLKAGSAEHVGGCKFAMANITDFYGEVSSNIVKLTKLRIIGNSLFGYSEY